MASQPVAGKLKKFEIKTAFVLVIINENFEKKDLERKGAAADKANIEKFCRDAGFAVNAFPSLKKQDGTDLETIQKTDDLKADDVKRIFKIISKASFLQYDAFICFISSHGSSEGIMGSDREYIDVNDISRRFNKCNTLTGKPKLFFMQHCRGDGVDEGIKLKTKKDGGKSDQKFSGLIPTEADILTAYSCVDGYESHRDEITGSWFITELTKVFGAHAVKGMQLTDMLAIVSENVSKLEDNGKQVPSYTSTLTGSVVFKVGDGRNK